MNMKESCPGSSEIRSPYPEDILCVFCGAKVEIWSDETETTCKKCTKIVSRDMKPSCLEWCPAARECVGLDKYEKIMKKLSEQNS